MPNPLKKIFAAVLLTAATTLNAQVVFEHVSATGIYDFLDELANQGHIVLNSAVKPYSRAFIAECLSGASKNKAQMPVRMQKELSFYMEAYFLELQSKEPTASIKFQTQENERFGVSLTGFHAWYRDSLLRISARPVAGMFFYKNAEDLVKHRWGGAEGYAYVGNQLGVYASLRDNNESKRITSPLFFNQRQGVPVKNFGEAGFDYSEMRGGIVYAWKWGSVGLIKDHIIWGENYNGSNILSGRAPSFAHISLKLKPARWLEFNYIHGWLVSGVVDSTRSYQDEFVYRAVFHDKYIAANMLTVTPLKKLSLSVGNSIIYSDLGVHPAYLNPFMFYKSVDHTLNGTNAKGETGQNAQMFASVSSRQIQKLHIYASAFFDELNIGRIKDGKTHNFYSLKGGLRTSGLLIDNLTLTLEYTLTRPLAYAHKISTTTFESNDFNLGHYLRDNSREIYLSASYKPFRGVTIKGEYIVASHYNDYIYGRSDYIDNEAFKDLTWQRKEAALTLNWEVAYNTGFRLAGIVSQTKGFDADGKTAQYYLDRYTPKTQQGKLATLLAGFFIGF